MEGERGHERNHNTRRAWAYCTVAPHPKVHRRLHGEDDEWMLKTETGKRLKAQLLEHAAYASRPKMADEAVKLLAYVASRTGKYADGRDFGIS